MRVANSQPLPVSIYGGVLYYYIFVCSRAAFVGQVGNLRPIVNRPTFGRTHHAGGNPTQFAACRYAGI
jgi:hypothetical protein